MLTTALRFRLLWACCVLTLILGTNWISRAKFGAPLAQGPLIRPLFWAIMAITCVVWALQAWSLRKQRRS